MGPSLFTHMHARFHRVVHRPCHEGEERPIQQITASIALLTVLSCCVDFALWGPHQISTARVVRCSGLVLGPIGKDGRYTLQTQEIKGPKEYALWPARWNVFQAALIFAGVCAPSMV